MINETGNVLQPLNSNYGELPMNYFASPFAYWNPYYSGYPNNYVPSPSVVIVHAPREEQNCDVFLQNYMGKFCAVAGHTKPHLVLDAQIDQLRFFNPDQLYNCEAFYAVSFRNNPNVLIISEKDFYNDNKLLSLLSRGCNQNIVLYKGSTRKTATLFRSFFSFTSKKGIVNFYYGWTKIDNWHFGLVGQKTHGTRPLNPVDCMEEAIVASPSASATNALCATAQVASLMETITSVTSRGILFLWFHTAALYSLLVGMNYRPPLGLCLFSTKSKPFQILRCMLEWYDDRVISLSEDPGQLLNYCLERKDQPLLLEDNAGKPENTSVLLQVLKTGSLPLSPKSKETRPLQALITVFSHTASPLTVSDHFLTLDLTFCDFSEDAFDQAANLSKYLPDYFGCFASFIEDHVDDLHEALYCGHKKAVNIADIWEISDAGTSALGIFYGMFDIIKKFHSYLAPQSELRDRLNHIVPNDWDTALLNMLQQAMDCSGELSDLAATFVAIAKEKLCRGDFDKRRIDGQRIDDAAFSGKDGIVYVDAQYYSFTRDAFSSVCRVCYASTPMILNALRDADILKGAKVNSTTSMTRITVRDRCGTVHIERVYKFAKEDLTFYNIN